MREAGAGHAERRRRGARSGRWLCGGAAQRCARLALATRRGGAEGREAGAGCVEGLRRGARGWRWPRRVAARRGARLALTTWRGYAEGSEADAGRTERRRRRWPGSAPVGAGSAPARERCGRGGTSCRK